MRLFWEDNGQNHGTGIYALYNKLSTSSAIFPKTMLLKVRHWKLCLPDLVGGISGFAVVWGLWSNCFGGFESEGKKGAIISVIA